MFLALFLASSVQHHSLTSLVAIVFFMSVDRLITAIVVPVFNEADHLDALLERLLAVTGSEQGLGSVIVVDDGSTDGSRDLLTRWSDVPGVLVRMHDVNRGKGAAIRTGLECVSEDWVVIQDADLEYDPADLPRLLTPLRDGQADFVYGSRCLPLPSGDAGGRRRFNVYALGVCALNWTVRVLYGLRVTDEATCYKVFRTADLRRMDLQCERFEFCPEVTAKAARLGLRIAELPIAYRPRNRAEGKKIGWRDAWDAFRTLWRYRHWTP